MTTLTASTTLEAPPSTPPAIPLDQDIRLAYQDLSARYQAAFDANPDYGFRLEVRDWKTDVDNILEKDAMYRLNANTALLEAIQDQIAQTNTDLVKVKAEIAAIAGDFALVGDILTAIDKVLTLVPA